jgi:MFS family permease
MDMVSAIWRLNIVTMLFFAFIQLVVPLIPRYALEIGATPFLIGLATASISITAIVFRPICGVLSDKTSRSLLMLLGLMLGAVAYSILFFSTSVNMIIIARLLEGIAIAAFVPSSIASAVDQAPPGKLGETLGWRSLMIGIGFMVGPALGGLISQYVGYNTTFGIAAILLLILIPFIFVKESPRVPTPKASSTGLKERGFILALSSLIIYAVAWMGLLTFLSAWLKLLGYGDLEIGLFVSIQALSSLVLRVSAGKWADRHPAALTCIGLFIISFAFTLIYVFLVPPMLYLAAVVFGFGVGAYIPGSQTLALFKSPAHSRGLLSSVYTMGMDIGNLIGPIAFGLIIQATGSYLDVFALAPLIVFMAAMVILVPTLMAYRKGKVLGVPDQGGL